MSIEKLVTQNHDRYGSVFSGSRESRKSSHNAKLKKFCVRFIMHLQSNIAFYSKYGEEDLEFFLFT